MGITPLEFFSPMGFLGPGAGFLAGGALGRRPELSPIAVADCRKGFDHLRLA